MKIIADAIQSGESHHPVFMDIYACEARKHMEKYGSIQRQLAVVSAKNHHHSTINPKTQYTRDFTVEEVLADVEIAYPLTRAM
ncbi:MAG: hypothetical protein SWK76_13385 [Actinomycetota bacterium]|nr:hypothetical protein [Actinomycetota bacterium]